MKIIIMAVFLSGCSLGPIHITHEEGSLPKIRIDTGYDECKLKAVRRGEARIVCVWIY